jgi:hypothetical protein
MVSEPPSPQKTYFILGGLEFFIFGQSFPQITGSLFYLEGGP